MQEQLKVKMMDKKPDQKNKENANPNQALI